MSARLSRGKLLPLAAGLAVVAMSAIAVPAAASTPWWLNRLNMAAAWQYSRGAGVTVAVLSTGVDGSLVHGVTTGPDSSDSGRHAGGQFWGIEGTGVASLIASVAPDVKILSLRVTLEYNDSLNSDPAITRRLPNSIASGINYAVTHGAQVIDLPLDPGTLGLNAAGQRSSDPAAAGGSAAEAAAVKNAITRGAVLVAPAGDNGASGDSVTYPASYPGVIAVGALTQSGSVASYSSRRSYVALLAPGSGLTVPTPPSGTTTLSTTDNAAAMVSGIAALIRARYPQLSVAQVTRALENGASGSATRRLADAAGALRSAAQLTSAASPAPKPSPRNRTEREQAVVTASGALADSVIRDAVLALGVLIVVIGAILLVARARAEPGQRGLRAVAGLRSAPRGSHARRARVTEEPSESYGGRRSRPGEPVGSGSLGLPPPTRRPGGASGGQEGRPALAPVPRTLRRAVSRGNARPPWEPAPAPAGANGTNPFDDDSPGPSAYRSTTPQPPGGRPFAPPALPLPSVREPLSLPPAFPDPEPYAAAPIPTDLPDWSHWNPHAITDSFPAIPPDPDNDSRP
ncbi:MAG: S8 family serine peptidase [Streptosporangiaceae bacterium]